MFYVIHFFVSYVVVLPFRVKCQRHGEVLIQNVMMYHFFLSRVRLFYVIVFVFVLLFFLLLLLFNVRPLSEIIFYFFGLMCFNAAQLPASNSYWSVCSVMLPQAVGSRLACSCRLPRSVMDCCYEIMIKFCFVKWFNQK